MGCVRSENYRAYHPGYGVVDGNHKQLHSDLNDCAEIFKAQSSEKAPSSSDETLLQVSNVAESVGESAIANVSVIAVFVKYAYDSVGYISACMKDKNWQLDIPSEQI